MPRRAHTPPDTPPPAPPAGAAAIDLVAGDPPVPITVWRTPAGDGQASVPFRLAERLVSAYSRPDEVVIDVTDDHALSDAAGHGGRRHHPGWFTDASTLIIGPPPPHPPPPPPPPPPPHPAHPAHPADRAHPRRAPGQPAGAPTAPRGGRPARDHRLVRRRPHRCPPPTHGRSPARGGGHRAHGDQPPGDVLAAARGRRPQPHPAAVVAARWGRAAATGWLPGPDRAGRARGARLAAGLQPTRGRRPRRRVGLPAAHRRRARRRRR